MTFNFFSIIRNRADRFYHCFAPTRLDRIRLTVFIVSDMMVLCIMPLHFFGLLGMPLIYLQGITLVFILLSLVSTVLFLFKRLSLVGAINLLCIGGQCIQTFRIVLLSLHPEWANSDVMTENLLISFLTLFVLVIAVIPKSPILVTALELPTIAFAHFAPPSGQTLCNSHLFLIFSSIQVFCCLMAVVSQYALSRLQQERNEYKDTQGDLLKAFGVDKQELVAFLQVWKSSPNNQTEWKRFLSRLDAKAQSRIVMAARMLEKEEKANVGSVSARFPMLTPTEVKVACLVIDGKTKREIAGILNKTESNIGTVRINIRRKLGLSASDDLREELRK